MEPLVGSLRELRRRTDIEVHERVDLRAWTALGVGGVARLVVRCHSESGVQEAIDLAACHGLGWVTLGGGSRLIPPDRGIAVPVLSLTGALARWEVDLDGLVSGCGANLAQLCRAAARSGLSGLDRLGEGDHSVGGLVRASAGGALPMASGLFDWVDLRRPGGEPERWQASDREPIPTQRSLDRRVATAARFRLRPAGLADLQPPGSTILQGRVRRSTSPVFVDSRDSSAADLLTEAGCASLAVGGVRLGETNANELFSGRSATSADVFDLCRMARERVLAATGVRLRPALIFVDESGREVGP